MGKYVDSFRVFESNYQAYADYAKTSMKWGSPSDLLQDATLMVKRIIPTEWDAADAEINSIEDQSSEQGIKFMATLNSGDVIHLYKTGPMRGSWEIYLNRKKQRNEKEARAELMKAMKPIDQYLLLMKGYDHTWHFADDSRAYRQGQAQAKELEAAYQALSQREKQQAYDQYRSKFGTDKSLRDFTGAY